MRKGWMWPYKPRIRYFVHCYGALRSGEKPREFSMSTWAADDDHAAHMAWRNFNQRYGLHVLHITSGIGGSGREVFIDNETGDRIYPKDEPCILTAE
jgi:hypothetical protein